MSVQIVIEGKHSTDVLSELRTLSEALAPTSPFREDEGVNEAPKVSPAEKMQRAKEISEAIIESGEASEAVAEVMGGGSTSVVVQDAEPEARTLKSREHKKVADKMISTRRIDNDLYGLLNEKHRSRVDAAFVEYDKEPVQYNSVQSAMDAKNAKIEAGLFDTPVETTKDEPLDVHEKEEAAEADLPDGVDLIITPDTMRDLIQKVATGADGKDDPAKYAKIRDLMRSVIPANVEVKISNIPTDKVEETYYEIAAI